MHEELYLPEKSFLKPAVLVCGIVLLPFALFNLSFINGQLSFVFHFDTALLLFAVGLSLFFFLPVEKQPALLNIPYAALLAAEFLRFGTVSLFNRVLPFDFYIASAAMFFAAFGNEFFIFFIAQGKLRSRLPLIILSVLMTVLAVCSLSVGFVPFAVYEQITTGDYIVSLSRGIALILVQLPAVLLAFALKSDKVKAEKKRGKQV